MTALPEMTSRPVQTSNIAIRPVQYRDLEAIEQIGAQESEIEHQSGIENLTYQLQKVRRWYGTLKLLSMFPNPYQYEFCAYVALENQQIRGMVQVSPFNRTRSTWRVERVAIAPPDLSTGNETPASEIGSQLLRHCFKSIVEAHNWLLEVNIHDRPGLAIYRQNGFQPLAELTYWAMTPAAIGELAKREPDLPNLLPVSNADAQLLYHLDTVAMPPLLRQVFDRQIHDFKTGIFKSVFTSIKQWLKQDNKVSGYVFEPQRKAAIGYFQLQLCRDGSQPHSAHLNVHPAYTWLYPELLSQMARILQEFPAQSLHLMSADYQPEREEYFEQLGAERIEHTLLMSRSVWHKIREAKPISLEGLQLSEVLKSLQPSRQPVPSRIENLQSTIQPEDNEKSKGKNQKPKINDK
jgi:ribosomal protein S18 acetylase RimI-like enzyme